MAIKIAAIFDKLWLCFRRKQKKRILLYEILIKTWGELVLTTCFLTAKGTKTQNFLDDAHMQRL